MSKTHDRMHSMIWFLYAAYSYWSENRPSLQQLAFSAANVTFTMKSTKVEKFKFNSTVEIVF